jgi:RNA methyltransferase, TrmH family
MISKSQIKYLNSLKLGKFRDFNREFIAEGVKLVEDVLDNHLPVRKIYALESWIESHKQLFEHQAIAIEVVTEAELSRVSSLVTPNEVLALVGYPETGIPSPEDLGKIILVLDRIQDPGNLGTIIRTADWFGIHDIFCSPDTADVYNPKVVQATMGSICRVGVHYTDLKQFLPGLGKNRHIYGTIPDAENIYGAELLFPAAIIIGNESKGISEELFPLIKHRIGIPSGPKGAESLNAAVAAGIVCSEFCRRL